MFPDHDASRCTSRSQARRRLKTHPPAPPSAGPQRSARRHQLVEGIRHALLVLLVPALAAAQPSLFRSAVNITLGGQPGGLTAADLNGDHHLDVVVGVATFPSPTTPIGAVNILLGNGTGTLARFTDASTQGFPPGIAAGLFDGDTIPDLLLSQFESNSMWFLHGRGDGTFANPRMITGGHDPWSVLAVDFNGDCVLDIVQSLATEQGGHVNVLTGNGDGTFAAPVGASTSGGNRSLTVADFNNDTLLDAAVPNIGADTVSVLLQRSDGTLAPHRDSPTGRAPLAIASGDVNQDGFMDVVVANRNDNTMSLLLGAGDGTFQRPQNFPVAQAPTGIVLTDLNGDDRLDAVVSNSGSSSVSLLLGTSDGSFAVARHFIADTMPVGVIVADLNEDGLPDVITANGGLTGAPSGTASVLYGRGTTLTGVEQLPAVSTAGIAAVADIDNDGLPDLATTFPAASRVGLYLARTAGGFTAPVTIDPHAQPAGVAFADVNGDGWPDLITANDSSPDLSLLLNHAGTFADPVALSLGSSMASAVIAADVDGDGRLDLVATLPSTNQVAILHGGGDGTFAAFTPLATGTNPLALASGDFDGDGQQDIAVANNGSDTVSILRAGGSTTLPVDHQPNGIVVLDANGDGFDDLAVLHAGGSIRVFLGNGHGAFNPGVTLQAQDTPAAIAARDLNGDQRADLIVANPASNTFSVFLNSSGGAFAAPLQVTVSPNPSAVVAADFDGDGRYDVAATGLQPAVATTVTVQRSLRGDGNGDGRVSAADLTALFGVVHLHAGVRVEQASTAGLDANGDGLVNAQDVIALPHRIFAGAPA